MRTFAILVMLALLSACQQTANSRKDTPQSIMLRVASQAQTCWFKNADPVFAKYAMATELNSPAGRPRILIVPKSNPAGLPKLVVQAQSNLGITAVATFGPLLDEPEGGRIQEDISRWAGGSKNC